MVRKTLSFVGLISLVTVSLFGQGLTTDANKGDWEEVNFAFDRAVLTDGYPSLLRLAELLKQHPDYKVKLEGHADHMGSDDYNIRLARQRAETVREFLVKYGASASQISAETYGENRPTSDNNLREGRWMNRRVEVTVTDGQGNIVSDGGVGDAITSLDDLLKAQEECCNKILKELEKLDDIMAMLKNLKDENAGLRDDVDRLKQAQSGLEGDMDKVASTPPGATTDQVREVIREEVPRGKTKYSAVNFNAGPDTLNGNLTVTGQGRTFIPFNKRMAVQAQGEFMHTFMRDEGQVDLGLVNRFGDFQAGVFSSFKYVKFDEFAHAGSLGQVSGTFDYIFDRGRVGLFGTRGFMDGSVVDTRILGPNMLEESYLNIIEQVGFSTAFAAWGDSWFEGNLGAQFRQFDSNKAGGTIRYVHPLTERLAFTAEAGVNESLIAANNPGRVAFGLQFGHWLSPKNYADDEDRPVPVDIPRIRYEVLTRQIRTGNDVPVADAGPDLIGIEAGPVVLDGSGSSDPDGDPITFEWQQVGGPTVALNGANTAQASFTAEEGQTYHFRLTVRDDQSGVGTDRVTVNTLERDISILRFTAEPLRITAGEPTNLIWEVRNATEVEISGIGTVDANGGSTTVSPTETTTYTLTARNPKREVNQTVTVTVDAVPPQDPPIIANFFATPSAIVLGQTATLTWDARNASDVTISGIGSVSAQGNTTVAPDQTTTYTITARNNVGEVSATATVTVRALGAQVEILTFTAEPGQLAVAGDPAVLKWETRNATKVVITGVGEVSLSGEVEVRPTVTTTYTLNATDVDGSEATAVVIVKIENINRSPVAKLTAPWLIPGLGDGTIGTLNGSASFDPDGDPITRTYRNVGNLPAEILDQGAERPRVKFTGGTGQYEFELEVKDEKGLRSFARVMLIVSDLEF
jgi:hypothetical protein